MSWWYRMVRHSAWVLTRRSYTEPKGKSRSRSATGGSRSTWSGEWDEWGFPDPILTDEERVQREAQREKRRREASRFGRRLIVVGAVVTAVAVLMIVFGG
jgi:hypothetical protein